MTSPLTAPTLPPPADPAAEREPSPDRPAGLWWEVGVAAAAFICFCVVVLLKASSLMEPDDYAYRAAIASLAHGHLELTTAQYKALAAQLGGIQQWTQLPDGRWMSEKNPGYPFFAVWFWWANCLRLAPLFAGGLASCSLFVAARKWLGRWAGTYAVVFFLASGMALAFAYRATMPTFTDASLLAAGAGAILWAMLSAEATVRRRTVVGLLGFASMEFAVFMRYTDVVVLMVAIAAVLCCWRPARLRWTSVAWWLGSVVAFGALVLGFDWAVYGSPTKTGYANGEITFSLSSIVPNLRHMPGLLVRAVPACLLGLVALAWVAVRLVRSRTSGTMAPTARAAVRRDGLVVGFVALGWLGLWALYSAYTWTAQMGGGPGAARPGGAPPGARLGAMGAGLPAGGGGGGGGGIHLIRFYVPAIGLIALLATWVVLQLPRWLGPLIAALAVLSAAGSFHSLVAEGGMGPAHRLPGGSQLAPQLGGSGGSAPGPGGFPQGGRPDGPPAPGNAPPGGVGGGPPGLRNGTMPDGRPPGR
jgi:hypothetical protein